MDNTSPVPNNLRFDLQIVASWIESGAKVLGLGCGNGDLLYYLKHRKDAHVTGIDIAEENVAYCIGRGLSVVKGDIMEEVEDYPDNTFDYVICSQTLQQIYNPGLLIQAMLKIGQKCIVSFPNFSHWNNRLQLLLKGHAPVSEQLPYQWHDTPNIRVITLKDFRQFADENGCRIIKEAAINSHEENRSGKVIRFSPNLRATYGIYLVGH